MEMTLTGIKNGGVIPMTSFHALLILMGIVVLAFGIMIRGIEKIPKSGRDIDGGPV